MLQFAQEGCARGYGAEAAAGAGGAGAAGAAHRHQIVDNRHLGEKEVLLFCH